MAAKFSWEKPSTSPAGVLEEVFIAPGIQGEAFPACIHALPGQPAARGLLDEARRRKLDDAPIEREVLGATAGAGLPPRRVSPRASRRCWDNASRNLVRA